jgi:iron complex transport system substrate-binding protein
MTNSNSEQNSQQPQRVVSLLGAATETLYRLGLGHTLVGRSHECDYPPACLKLPCISRPRLDVNGTSKEIDDAVRLRSAAGEPVYKLDDEVLGTLAPLDLLIAQDHCRVCAVTPNDVKNSEVMACANVKQLVLSPATLSDCMMNVNEIANAMGVPERGVTLRRTLEERMDRVKHLVMNSVDSSESTKPRVALLEWCDPIMGCGYWIPELIEVAGGKPLHCPPPGGATPTLSFDTLLDSKPDVVIFALCGFGLTRAAAEIKLSWKEPWIQKMKETTKNRMFLVDGNYLVNRSGPRVVESCEALAEAMHPHLQGHFGHFGTDLLTTFDSAMALAEAGEHTGSTKIRPEPFLIQEQPTNQLPAAGDTSTATKNVDDGNTKLYREGPGQVVSTQLKYLEQGDVVKAFALNSIANQDRWCGPGRFSNVLKSHGDYRRLLKEPATVGNCNERDGISTVVVTLPANEKEETKEVSFLWTMILERLVEDEKEEEHTFVWRTEKVGSPP